MSHRRAGGRYDGMRALLAGKDAKAVRVYRHSERSDDLENLVPLLPHKGALAIAAVIDIALNARERPVAAKALATRLRLPPRHLEPMLQALVHHGILKGTRGPRGGYELAREQRRITADHILRAIGMADEMERMPFAGSNLLCKVVIPALEQAERAFSAMLARINVEDLAHSAGALRKSAGATSTFAP
jgi:Rrf2 family transcriptional regulator, iron-sulfur cluster assembly transcription factor